MEVVGCLFTCILISASMSSLSSTSTQVPLVNNNDANAIDYNEESSEQVTSYCALRHS